MLRNLRAYSPLTMSERPKPWLLLLLAGATLLAAYLNLKLQQPVVWILPIGLLGAMTLIWDYRALWYLLMISIPASLHLEFGSLALDMPSEPLMVVFLAIWFLNVLGGNQRQRGTRLYTFHILIFLLIFWTVFTTLVSYHPDRSVKFLLSRLWYIGAFVWMGEKMLHSHGEVKRTLAFFMGSLAVFSLITTLRHIPSGFSFEGSHFAPGLFFTNHVIYGCIVTMALPWVWLLWKESKPDSRVKKAWRAVLALVLLGVFLSYARGAWVSFIASLAVIWLVEKRFFRPAIFAGLVVATLGIAWLVQGNNYYRFAPDYKTTVFHEGDLSGHLSATFEGNELSGMERFYRWVAAFRMVGAEPLKGFGPSAFNQTYRRYANDAFRTYVSDNPEQSTTHNYFLMTFAEQGMVGGLLWVGFCVYMLLKGARLAQTASTPERRRMALVAVASIAVFLLHSLLNELLEVDKAGSLFWINVLVIHLIEKWEDNPTSAHSLPA